LFHGVVVEVPPYIVERNSSIPRDCAWLAGESLLLRPGDWLVMVPDAPEVHSDAGFHRTFRPSEP
jgi:hypothetical protein